MKCFIHATNGYEVVGKTSQNFARQALGITRRQITQSSVQIRQKNEGLDFFERNIRKMKQNGKPRNTNIRDLQDSKNMNLCPICKLLHFFYLKIKYFRKTFLLHTLKLSDCDMPTVNRIRQLYFVINNPY